MLRKNSFICQLLTRRCAHRTVCGAQGARGRKGKGMGRKAATRARDAAPRSVEKLVSHRVITLANLLRRSASLRYRRMFGLALIEWRIIAVLGAARSVSLNELARRAGLGKSQMSRGVAGLVARRLVSRATSARDNREIALALGPKGRAIFAALSRAADERNRALVAGLSRDDLRRLDALLDMLTEGARALLRAEESRPR